MKKVIYLRNLISHEYSTISDSDLLFFYNNLPRIRNLVYRLSALLDTTTSLKD